MATVFLVDDEVLTTMALEQMVARMGHEVVGTARDGQEALTRIEDADPDVAVVDLRMPYMDGLELATHIATRVPVILLTAHASADTVGRALEVGAVTVLEKPVREHELQAAIATASTVRGLWRSQLRLERKLNDRKWIDRAKAKLVADEGMDDDAAYRHISGLARSSRRGMGDVAREILGVTQADEGDAGGGEAS